MTQTYLAFDFGMKRIGVAVGQTITKTASALEFLSAQDGIPQWPLLERLIKDWEPNALIVGIPLKMDGTEQELTFCARKFANRLREKFNLEVIGIDERLSTIEARNRLFTQGGYKALKKGKIDSVAAKILLEDFLNSPLK